MSHTSLIQGQPEPADKENKAHLAPKRTSVSMLGMGALRRSSATSLFSNYSHSADRRASAFGIRRLFSGRSSRHSSALQDACSTTNRLISLPTPVEGSRDKLRSKLRSTPSLLNLNASAMDGGTNESFTVYQERRLYELLTECSSQKVLQAGELPIAVPLEDGVTTVRTRTQALIVKCMSFGPCSFREIGEVLRQVRILKHTMRVSGFAQMTDIWVVSNCVDVSPSDSLDGSPAAQDLHLVMATSYAGTPLAEFTLANWPEAYEVFWQVAACLDAAERRFHFEHRDLHPGHILVERNPFTTRVSTTVTGLDFARLTCPENGEILFSRLDHPHFFEGSENQKRVYRGMQQILMDIPGDTTEPDWSRFESRTNVLWLHHLAEYLLAVVPPSVPDHLLRKRLVQVEQTLNPARRRFIGGSFKDFTCAGDVVSWGNRVLR